MGVFPNENATARHFGETQQQGKCSSANAHNAAAPNEAGTLDHNQADANPGLSYGPAASASSTDSTEGIAEAIDGRVWFFPENRNGWSPALNGGQQSWYSVHFERMSRVGSVELYFFSDGQKMLAPRRFKIQYHAGSGWFDIPSQRGDFVQPVANGMNRVTFPAISMQDLRLLFDAPQAPANFRLIELEAFAP